MREENHIRKNHYYKIGTAYEEQAVLFLEKEGYEILERNFHSYHGEIDIIAREDEYLVFVEVKYRRAAYPGSVDPVGNTEARLRRCVPRVGTDNIGARPCR